MNTNNILGTYKLVLVGAGGVGKSSLVIKMKNKNFKFNDKYFPTLGVEVQNLIFRTSHGIICFNVWDIAGQQKFQGLRDGYYIGGDCAIVMYSLENQESVDRSLSFVSDLLKHNINQTKIVLCRNKINTFNDTKYRTKDLRDKEKLFGSDVLISTKHNLGIISLLGEICRKVTGISDLYVEGEIRPLQ